MLPSPSVSILTPSQPVLTNPWRVALGFAQVYPEYPHFLGFHCPLSIVPNWWLCTPFVGGIGFNSAKASCLPREGGKEGHLGIINSRVCGLQLSTLGPNVWHWSRVFSVWSKKAVSSPLRGPQAGLLWGLRLLGILINSLVGLMDYQAVSWQRGLRGEGWGEQIAAHKSACCLPSLCFNGSWAVGRQLSTGYIFLTQQMVLTG